MQNKTNDQVYAGFFVRLAAYLVDMLIVGAALIFVRIPMLVSAISNPENLIVREFFFQYSIADIIIYLLSAVYFIWFTHIQGATIGKKLFHLKVVSIEDRKPTFFELLYRETVGRFLSGIIANFGYLMIGFKSDKRGLHDMLSDTKVVYAHTDAKTEPMSTDAYVPATYVQPEERKPSKVIHVGLKEHAAVLKKRLLKRIPAEKLQTIEIELKIVQDIQTAESYRISKREERWVIEGSDQLGLYYGIGKFLDSAEWTEDAIYPVETEEIMIPENEIRTSCVSVWNQDWYQTASLEELERFVEELLLSGYNTIACKLPNDEQGLSEEELVIRLDEKTRVIYQTAKKYGMHMVEE